MKDFRSFARLKRFTFGILKPEICGSVYTLKTLTTTQGISQTTNTTVKLRPPPPPLPLPALLTLSGVKAIRSEMKALKYKTEPLVFCRDMTNSFALPYFCSIVCICRTQLFGIRLLCRLYAAGVDPRGVSSRILQFACTPYCPAMGA